MQREGYWDYMGSRLQERRIEEMQKSLEDCYERIVELNDEMYKLKVSRYVSRQLEFEF